MHIALPMPKRKTLVERIGPPLSAALLVAVGAMLIPVSYPVYVTNGKITPDVVTAAEPVKVYWLQNWKQLCPVTVTREFIGNDGFKVTAAHYDLQPPDKKGISDYHGTLIVPTLPVGKAYYRSTIEPHCWIDLLYQRSYKTPEVEVAVVKAPPSGPH